MPFEPPSFGFLSSLLPRKFAGGAAFVFLFCGQHAAAKDALTEEAASTEESAVGPGFALLVGESGVQGCLPRPASQDTLRQTLFRVNQELLLDPALAVVFSLDVPSCSDIFYVPVENDVRGLGYGYFFDEEIFDLSPDSALEGIAFLNDAPYWESHEQELARAFLHELGHRWSGRVRVTSEHSTEILGRDLEHWSYFLDAGSSPEGLSPLLGNRWESTLDGFRTASHNSLSSYSELDLYLMGVLEPEGVKPFAQIVAEVPETARDCQGEELRSDSPPQLCEPLSFSGSRIEWTIQDVIESEGMRVPAGVTRAEPLEIDVAFYFLAPEAGFMTRDTCVAWSARILALEEQFERATSGRMILRNLTRQGITDTTQACEKLLEETFAEEPSSDARGESSGCHIARSGGRPALPYGAVSVWLCLAAWALRRSRTL